MESKTIHTKCLRCGRPLKNPEYQKIGYGKSCYEKVLDEIKDLSRFSKKKDFHGTIE